MVGKLLLVDDEPHILDGYRRDLRVRFDVLTATGGKEALEILETQGPFGVVVSDLRMPEMDGVQFLREAKRSFPDTVRIMLTGNADLQAAADAVNEGNIFRFHTKPCDLAVLGESIDAALLVHDEMSATKAAAESAGRLRSEILANLNHELRTPLNHIIGFSEIIAGGAIPQADTEKHKEFAQHILDSGTHLLGIINNIVDLSDVRAGAYELAEVEANLKDIVEASIDLAKKTASFGDVTLTTFLLKESLCIFADAPLLVRALSCLISNALRFADSEVVIQAIDGVDGDLVVEILDDGIGIAEGDLEKAAELFSQVDGGLARKYEGTGIGLPLARAVVELHNGTLALCSREGIGTQVIVRLPAERLVRSAA